ncbi:MAG TPA: SOS response-associated peptidase [Steroidobacteraceae bacterium]|nr:SOS response-associated peptidase [Steroidobacteraceae bacterium]
MSRRLVIPDQAEAEQDIPVTHGWWTFSTRYNVAPSQRVPVARIHEKESEGVMMRWGLIPSSTKGDEPGPGVPSIGRGALDSREEYRPAWLNGQRCVVPVAGFYLWQRDGGGHSQPHYVRLVNRVVFGIAALWDRFVTDDDDVIEGCALILVPGNSLTGELDGSQGMPAILHRDRYDAWLRARPAEARDLLQTYPSERMVMHPVGPHVNFPEYDDPRLIRPIG